MRMSAAFPSAYLKAADLGGRRIRIKMDRVEMEDIGGDHKPVLLFLGTDKKMVLNKTNASEIIDAYGDETEAWRGCEIELYEARVEFQGKKVAAIRVNAMLAQRAAQTQAPFGQVVESSTETVNGSSHPLSLAGREHQRRIAEKEARENGTLPERAPFEDEIPF